MASFLVFSTALLSAAAAPAWPLENVQTLMAEGELHTEGGHVEPVQEWYQFTAKPCEYRSRIDYPEVKVIEIAENGALSKVLFANLSTGQHCTTTGPTPISETQCQQAGGQWNEMGTEYNFTGQQPCPAPRSAQICDLWTYVTPNSEQTQLFLSGTAQVVQSSVAIDSKAPDVTTYSTWSVNTTIPASAWQTPSSWLPCTPE